MRNYEIKKIGSGSVFKFYFVVGAIFGLLTSIIVLIMGATLKNIGLELGTFSMGNGSLQTGAMITGVILASLAYGLLAGVVSAVGALIYNLLAAAVGGIVIKLGDKE